ncbi:MAG: nucleotidyltransferase family protein [Candidatus Bathyarchaeia archaeon]
MKQTPKSVDQIRCQLKVLEPTLKECFKVESIKIFGSYARGEQTNNSDIDLIVSFSAPYDLWEFLDLKEFLIKRLHKKVDLVPKDSIKSSIRDQILQEATPI